MSREENERPKRPRINKTGGPGHSRNASRPSRGDGPKNPRFSGNRTEGGRPQNRRTERDFPRRDAGIRSSGESRESYITGGPTSRRPNDETSPREGNGRFSGENRERKPGGSRSFDSRDKYEKGNSRGKSSSRGGFRPSQQELQQARTRNFVQKRRLEKIEKEIEKDTLRLNKYIANSGVSSRRQADELIRQGLVTVNGQVVTEMGYQVKKTDKVSFDGQNLTPEKPVYVLLNKPKGYISTTNDEKMRKTVVDLVANASPYRLYPVGRLDRSTTGVILLTNDGHMTKKLTHPSFGVKKIYHVTLDRKLSSEDLEAIQEGIRLEEGVAMVDSISFIEGKPKNEIGVEIHIGWNRVIRRIFQRLGYEVEGLDRVMFAGLTKKNVKRGHWRILTDLEVNNLKML